MLLPVLGVTPCAADYAAIRAHHLGDPGGGIWARRLPAAEYFTDVARREPAPDSNLLDPERTGCAQPSKEVRKIASRP